MPARKEPKDYRALARIRGLVWLGAEAPGTPHPTTWRCCRHGHVFERSYNRIQSIQDCPVCAGKLTKTPADYRALAKERGFTWVGSEVATTSIRTDWRCARGHTFAARYSTLQQGSGCPHCCHKAPKTRADYAVLARTRQQRYNTIHQGSGCPECARFDPAERARTVRRRARERAAGSE